MIERDSIPQAKLERISKIDDLGILALRIYRTGIKLATEANRKREAAKGSISNDRGLIVENDERNFIKSLFAKKGWIINIRSKRIPPNDIQKTYGQSYVEISVKKGKKKK